PPPMQPEPETNWTPPPPPPPPPIEESIPLFETQERAPVPKVVTTLPGYVFLSSENDALSLVDQRAAHSRILYEKLVDQDENPSDLQIQNLLIPYTLEVTPLEATTLSEVLPSLNKLGVNIQEFGNQSFIVHALPQIWADANIRQLITEIANNFREYQRG
ncbi:MAG: hypothetical protein ACE5GN_04050, partial [Waddliaceae bacterium]